jgi:hypothetical protein
MKNLFNYRLKINQLFLEDRKRGRGTRIKCDLLAPEVGKYALAMN